MPLKIGKKLRQYRKKANFSVKFVASALSENGFRNCSASAIYNWEQDINYPNIDIFAFLCNIYNVGNIDDILRNHESDIDPNIYNDLVFINENYKLLNIDGRNKILSYLQNIVNCNVYRVNNSENPYIMKYIAKGGETGEIEFDDAFKNNLLNDIKILSKNKKRLL